MQIKEAGKKSGIFSGHIAKESVNETRFRFRSGILSPASRLGAERY